MIESRYLPDAAAPVDAEFAALYAERLSAGARIARDKKVAIVGLVRDADEYLASSLESVATLGKAFLDWRAFIFENDSKDDTKQILGDWASAHPGHALAEMENNGRERLYGFEEARVLAFAQYRNRLREMVRRYYAEADFVIAIDLDAWGGWSQDGVMTGVAWHEAVPAAACMASTSLFQNENMRIGGKLVWGHYDQWAFRLYGWTPRMDTWFTLWVPPPGHPPIRVLSAFGGLAIYKTKPWLTCEYESDSGDMEHAGLHRRMMEAGWEVYLNPSQRCVMAWVKDNGGQHGDDQH